MDNNLDYSTLAKEAIYLDDQKFEAFLKVLENPPKPNDRLIKLFKLEDVFVNVD